MSKHLVGVLGLGLSVELDENARDLLVSAGLESLLGAVDLRDQALQLGSAPVDRVDLLANQSKESQAVGRSLLSRNPSCRQTSRLGINRGGLCALMGATLLDGLEAFTIGGLDELDLGLLELHGDLVALLDEIINLFGVASDPDVLDGISKHLAELALVHVYLGDRGEKDCSGRDTVGVVRRQEEGLANVDVEDALSQNHVHDKAIECPGTENVGIVSVLARRCAVVDVRVREDIQLSLATAAGCVDREQNGPQKAAAKEGDVSDDTQEAQE